MKKTGIRAIVRPMKSPLLILFIILNLLAINMASAMNIYSQDAAESHIIHGQDDQFQDADAVLASCIDDSNCDHLCHISSHIVGYISQLDQPVIVTTTTPSPALNEQIHYLALEPPFLPPQA